MNQQRPKRSPYLWGLLALWFVGVVIGARHLLAATGLNENGIWVYVGFFCNPLLWFCVFLWAIGRKAPLRHQLAPFALWVGATVVCVGYQVVTGPWLTVQTVWWVGFVENWWLALWCFCLVLAFAMASGNRKAFLLVLKLGLPFLIILHLIVQGDLRFGDFILALGHPWWLALGVLCQFVAMSVGAPRWQILLHAHDIRPGFWQVFRLTYIGYFFNAFIPGGTGGDFVKAYYASKATNKRAEAVTTVFIDRVVGLYAFTFMGAAAVLWQFKTLWSKSSTLVIVILAMFAAGTAGMAAFYLGVFQFLARVLKGENIVVRTLRKVNAAAHLFRERWDAIVYVFLYTLLLQTSAVVGCFCFGRAIDDTLSAGNYFFLIPVGLVINAIPLGPMGAGVGEYGFKKLFGIFSSPKGAAIAAVFHVAQFFIGLIGCVFYLQGRAAGTVEAPPQDDGSDTTEQPD